MQSSAGEQSVYVRHEPTTAVSSHVVDLKTTQKTPWHNVEIYEEKKPTPPARKTMDVAKMIRQANAHVSETRTAASISKKESHAAPVAVFLPSKTPTAETAQRKSISSRIAALRDSLTPRRAIAVFLCLLLLVGVPFPAVGYYQKLRSDSTRVVEESTNAFLSLQSSTVAAFQANIDQATSDLNLALQSFESANSIVEQDHKALVYVASLLPFLGKHISSRQHLLSAGHHLALGNTYLVKGVTDVESQDDAPLTDRLEIFRAHLIGARAQYREALADLGGIDSRAIPSEYQQSFKEFSLLFAAFVDDMDNAVELLESMKTMFGGEQFQRYLILFQNEHELRPTGGFLGSFAILDVQKGNILNIDVPGGGTYDVKGQLDRYVVPPLPLQLMNGRWEFQDANWFPDFAESAKKAEWFYTHSRGATVDGVIAINASVLERILGVIGPVTNDDYALVLDAEHALDTLQHEVEVDYNKEENTPKAVLGSVLANLMERIGDMDQLQVIGLIRELNKALSKKEIQVFMHDRDAQKQLVEYGWSGTVAKTAPTQDYLYVVHANLQGQKSDAKISEDISHRAVVEKDGSVVDTVVIRRNHEGTPGELFYGVRNTDYVRLYVPEGATLLDAGGFDYPPEEAFKVPEEWYAKDMDLSRIEHEDGVHAKTGTRVTREFGKTVFGNWTSVDPGGVSEVYFTYRLPFRLIPINDASADTSWIERVFPNPPPTSRYSMLVQKQSGTTPSFSSQIVYPQDWKTQWKTNDALDIVLNGAALETTLEKDLIYGVVMEQVR